MYLCAVYPVDVAFECCADLQSRCFVDRTFFVRCVVSSRIWVDKLDAKHVLGLCKSRNQVGMQVCVPVTENREIRPEFADVQVKRGLPIFHDREEQFMRFVGQHVSDRVSLCSLRPRNSASWIGILLLVQEKAPVLVVLDLPAFVLGPARLRELNHVIFPRHVRESNKVKSFLRQKSLRFRVMLTVQWISLLLLLVLVHLPSRSFFSATAEACPSTNIPFTAKGFVFSLVARTRSTARSTARAL
jgi:hypothetical protein